MVCGQIRTQFGSCQKADTLSRFSVVFVRGELGVDVGLGEGEWAYLFSASPGLSATVQLAIVKFGFGIGADILLFKYGKEVVANC